MDDVEASVAVGGEVGGVGSEVGARVVVAGGVSFVERIVG